MYYHTSGALCPRHQRTAPKNHVFHSKNCILHYIIQDTSDAVTAELLANLTMWTVSVL